MSLIRITVTPQPMDENFDAVMDAAYREVRIAEHAGEMLSLLQDIYRAGEFAAAELEPHQAYVGIHRNFLVKIHAAIANATGSA